MMFVAGALAAVGAAYGSQLLLMAAFMVYSAAEQEKMERAARARYNAAQKDRLNNLDSAVAPRHLPLGRVRKGGNVVFRGATGTNKERAFIIIELGFGEIDAVETIYLNDVAVTLDADGWVQTEPWLINQKISTSTPVTGLTTTLPHTPVEGSVAVISGTASDATDAVLHESTVDGDDVTVDQDAVDAAADIQYQYIQYTSKARVTWHLGAGDQTADASLMAAMPTEWTPEHRGRGSAYILLELIYNETAFPSGVPVATAVLRGAKVYDPRTGLTAWSENPALLMRHIYNHPWFGNKTVSAEEDARFIAAANVCDTPHDYVVDGVTTTRALYTAALVMPYGSPAKDALDSLASAMAGSWAYHRGQIFVRAGAYTAPVMTLTEADLAVEVRQSGGEQVEQQAISVTVHRARVDKFNVVNMRIWDAGQDYKEAALTPLKATALIARDGAELPREMELSCVTYAPQALHVAGVLMRDARDPLTVTATFKLKAYPLEILVDTVALTIPRYGWDEKEFLVVGRSWTLTGMVQLALKETAPEHYTPDAEFSAQGYAANTGLPNPVSLLPPGTLSFSTGTSELVVVAGAVRSRVRASWGLVPDSTVTEGGQVEVQYKAAGADAWNAVVVPGSETQAILTEVQDGQVLLVRARCRNRLAIGDWGVQQSCYVVGQTERPSVPTNFTVHAIGGQAVCSWTLHEAVDVRYGGKVVVRHAPAVSGAAWEDGYIVEAFDGNATTGVLPLITGTYMAKAQDAAGNWSEGFASFVGTEGMVTSFTTVTTVTEDPAFGGTLTDLVNNGGVLQLSGDTLIDDVADLIDAWGYLDSLGGLAAAGEYAFTSTLDLSTVAVRRFEVDLAVSAFDADDLIDSRLTAVDSWAAIDGDEINSCDATVLARTTPDDPAGAPTWSAWTPFMVADFNCRAAQFKLQLTSSFETHNILCEQLRVAVKVPA